MALSVGSTEDDEPISTINTTPLVDVMLVLLIIFMIATPLITAEQTIPINLPSESKSFQSVRVSDCVCWLRR